MTVDPGQMQPQIVRPEWMAEESFASWLPHLQALAQVQAQTPVPALPSPQRGRRPAAATTERGVVAAAGSIREPEIVEGDLVWIGVALYRVGLAPDGSRLVLEGPLNKRPERGLW